MNLCSRLILIASVLILLIPTVAYLIYFGVHTWSMLHFAYPLDYGEGPLLAQVQLLRSGMPLGQLYGDPAAWPYAVVNYPPIYPLITLGVSRIIGDMLQAGRLVAVVATLGCVCALFWLTNDSPQQRRSALLRVPMALLPALLFLSVPIVREWGVLLRVDMLGICLGLWGMVAVQQIARLDQTARRRQILALIAGLLLLLTLYTKPSLIAAPAAACLWLGWLALRPPAPGYRTSALIVLGILGIGGGLLFALCQWASHGWFYLHVVAANANRWEADLAIQFWIDQMRLRWPLVVAAMLGLLLLGLQTLTTEKSRCPAFLLPLFYTLGGLLTAVGVGKVGAYTNYFLEFYAGLIWLSGLALLYQPFPPDHQTDPRSARWPRFMGQSALLLFLAGSLIYYPPTWSMTSLHRAGLLEPQPPRLAFGQYNLWHDLQREVDVLAARGRVQQDLIAETHAAGEIIFTDFPGIAPAAGVLSRMQVFEQRQLLDQGFGDQQKILLELANGELPLALIEFLGNWLTPEVIEVIQRRYAQDGSRNSFDLYRPVAPGSLQRADQSMPGNLHLSGYRLAPPNADQYVAGELLVLTLEWQRSAEHQAQNADPAAQLDQAIVIVQLMNASGQIVLQSERPLLYGVFPPEAWPVATVVQHIQPLSLPVELPPGDYTLALAIETTAGEQTPARPFAKITLTSNEGRWFAETNYFVPARILATWQTIGGLERAGYPLTPAVPFAWGTLQCFERVCLEQRGAVVSQRPLGEQHFLAETLRTHTCASTSLNDPLSPVERRINTRGPDTRSLAICPDFLNTWTNHGPQTMGPAISGEIWRDDDIIQWTRYARLERLRSNGAISLGRLGDDTLRLAPGMRYRWP